MPKTVDEAFEKIISDALDEADGIDCPLEDYIANLRGWKDEIEMRVQAAESDVERLGGGDD